MGKGVESGECESGESGEGSGYRRLVTARCNCPHPHLDSPDSRLSDSSATHHPPQGHHQERAGAAGRIQQPTVRLACVADLIEHVSGQPVGRVVLAKLPPQRPREQVLIERLEQIAAAVGRGRRRCQVVAGQCVVEPLNQPLDRLRRRRPIPGERTAGQQVAVGALTKPRPVVAHQPTRHQVHQHGVIRLQGEQQRVGTIGGRGDAVSPSECGEMAGYLFDGAAGPLAKQDFPGGQRGRRRVGQRLVKHPHPVARYARRGRRSRAPVRWASACRGSVICGPL